MQLYKPFEWIGAAAGPSVVEYVSDVYFSRTFDRDAGIFTIRQHPDFHRLYVIVMHPCELTRRTGYRLDRIAKEIAADS